MSLIVNPGSGGNTNFTDGSIPYASGGILVENNSKIRWDNTNSTLYVNGIPWTTSGISSLYSIFTPSGTATVSTDLQTKVRELKSVLDYMTAAERADVLAKTFTVDVTTALQAAITDRCTLNGGGLFWPDGGYKITAALTIPFACGWLFQGASRLGTVIKQYTSNTPIFRFTSTDTHSWAIQDMKFDYSAAAASTDTAACPIYFVGSASSPSFYNFTLERLNFNNCAICVGGDNSTKFSVWGFSCRDWTVQSSVTRSVIRVVPSTVVGQPNIELDHLYIRADTMVGPVFEMSACAECKMDNIEINLASLSPQLFKDASGGSYDIGNFRLEGGTYTAANPMFLITNDNVQIRRFSASSVTYNASSGSNPYVFTSNSANITITELDLSGITVSAGTMYVLNGTSSLQIDHIVGGLPPANLYLTNLGGSASANSVRVNKWLEPRFSADKGDADTTIAVGDPTIIYYNTPITADRTVNLPATTNSNAFNGLNYKVVRTAACTGAFNIIFNGKNIATPGSAMTNTYIRTSWKQTEYGVFL